MNTYEISVTGMTERFYKKIALAAGLPMERVLADAIQKTAEMLVLKLSENKNNLDPKSR